MRLMFCTSYHELISSCFRLHEPDASRSHRLLLCQIAASNHHNRKHNQAPHRLAQEPMCKDIRSGPCLVSLKIVCCGNYLVPLEVVTSQNSWPLQGHFRADWTGLCELCAAPLAKLDRPACKIYRRALQTICLDSKHNRACNTRLPSVGSTYR